MTQPQVALLADGRLHLQHGPIDLICHAWGTSPSVQRAYGSAVQRFQGLLSELVAELPALRQENAALFGPIARKMGDAVSPFRPAFITPMAAVAGAVAESVLAAMGHDLDKAYVNNGGDIALLLSPGQSLTAAIGLGPRRVTINSASSVRGIATSGWGGRSYSLGIADAVTVLAATAAQADAAATMIANAVDLPGHRSIDRTRACDLQPDTDLGTRRVTTGVGTLAPHEIDLALSRGLAAANRFRARGLIDSCALFLKSQTRVVGPLHLKELQDA